MQAEPNLLTRLEMAYREAKRRSGLRSRRGISKSVDEAADSRCGRGLQAMKQARLVQLEDGQTVDEASTFLLLMEEREAAVAEMEEARNRHIALLLMDGLGVEAFEQRISAPARKGAADRRPA